MALSKDKKTAVFAAVVIEGYNLQLLCVTQDLSPDWHRDFFDHFFPGRLRISSFPYDDHVVLTVTPVPLCSVRTAFAALVGVRNHRVQNQLWDAHGSRHQFHDHHIHPFGFLYDRIPFVGGNVVEVSFFGSHKVLLCLERTSFEYIAQ